MLPLDEQITHVEPFSSIVVIYAWAIGLFSIYHDLSDKNYTYKSQTIDQFNAVQYGPYCMALIGNKDKNWNQYSSMAYRQYKIIPSKVSK